MKGILAAVLLPLVAALLLPNVPYHRQITEYSCGDATMEMLLHWSGMDVDQRAIIDVMRTSNYEGTLSFDLQRALHFSELSLAPPEGLYPSMEPVNGWEGRALGLAAFQRRDTSCWVDDLTRTLDAGFPVGVLMHFSDPSAHDGHFRVVIGHDPVHNTITMLDPWDRTQAAHADFVRQSAPSASPRPQGEARSFGPVNGNALQPRVFVLPREQFCALWNYRERNFNDTFDPYFGVVGAPFRVEPTFAENAENNTLDITAKVTYPLPPAFESVARNFSVINAAATLSLPPSLALAPGGAKSIALGTMSPGETRTVAWSTLSDDSQPKPKVQTFITVTVFGVVSGSVPDMSWSSNITRPGYRYNDLIGGQAQLSY